MATAFVAHEQLVHDRKSGAEHPLAATMSGRFLVTRPMFPSQ
jgi:hypothetical protein